jgi:hypothetical protein
MSIANRWPHPTSVERRLFLLDDDVINAVMPRREHLGL